MRHALPYGVLWPQGSCYLGLSLTPIFALSIVTESWLGHATQKKRKKDDCTGLGSLPSEYQPNSHSFPPLHHQNAMTSGDPGTLSLLL